MKPDFGNPSLLEQMLTKIQQELAIKSAYPPTPELERQLQVLRYRGAELAYYISKEKKD